MKNKKNSMLNSKLLLSATSGAFKKLSPAAQLKNPVMFTVYIGACVCTALFLSALIWPQTESPLFILHIAFWLWATIIFSNFAEAIAETRGQAQAQSLRQSRSDISAALLNNCPDSRTVEIIPALSLRKEQIVLVKAGEVIPGDGEVIEGIASVDESAITGESAPVVRQSGGDKSSVTCGTKVISDWLIIKITADPGDTFLDRIIKLVEGSQRQKSPNELALSILLAGLTLLFLCVCVVLLPLSDFSVRQTGIGQVVSLTVLISLFVCLAPTTIGALVSAIGIAGMDRMLRKNVIAFSGKAVESAGDIDVLLLDKTGTITLGNRQAVEFRPAPGFTEKELAEISQIASLADETPEGRSIVILAKEQFQIREQELSNLGGKFIPFSAYTRTSGVDLPEAVIRKGASDSIREHVQKAGGVFPEEVENHIKEIARKGGTPLVVSRNAEVAGVIYLKDIIKGGIRERFAELRKMGIKTVMITGDNHLTAAAIAAEAGVDDFLAEATPEAKLNLIKDYQKGGRMVAMTGDGTNDAPALAQADVALAMNSGTQAAKEAGNLIDLDSNPTKLIEVVETGKQLLMTRGSLTTFSIANDLAKYFAIIPAAFAGTFPKLGVLNVMQLGTPNSAVLSAVIFNAVVIPALIPLALNGVKYRAVSAQEILKSNLLIYGLGGVLIPFIGIKLIDLLINLF